MKKLNIFNKKNKGVNSVNLEDIWQVKDLYTTEPSIITKSKKNENETIHYNELNKELEQIVVIKVDEKFVKDIISGRIYGRFSAFDFRGVSNFVGQYMVDVIRPLELELNDKTKRVITRDEVIEFLYHDTKQEETSINEYSDAVLRQINETNKRITKSSLDEEVKDKMREELLNIANYYVNTLKQSTNANNQSSKLSLSQTSIVSLRKECMDRLVKLEMMLPPDSINSLEEELLLLENEIKRLKR